MVSRVGIAFCVPYAIVIAACVAMSFGTGDPKGGFVFLQLPIALQGGLLQAIGFGPLLSSLSWVPAYLLLALPTFAALYWLGRSIERWAKQQRP